MKKKREEAKYNMVLAVKSEEFGQHIIKAKKIEPLFTWNEETDLVSVQNSFYLNVRHYAFLKQVRVLKISSNKDQSLPVGQEIETDLETIKKLGIKAPEPMAIDQEIIDSLAQAPSNEESNDVVSENLQLLTFEQALDIAQRHLSHEECLKYGLFEYKGPYFDPKQLSSVHREKESMLCGMSKSDKALLKDLAKRRDLSVQGLIEESLTRKVYGVGAKIKEKKKTKSVIFYFSKDEMALLDKAVKIYQKKTKASKSYYSETIRFLLEEAGNGNLGETLK